MGQGKPWDHGVISTFVISGVLTVASRNFTPATKRRNFSTPTTLAEELGVSDRTVRRWIAEGRLKAIRLSERVIRIEPAEVERFLAAAQTSGDISPDAA
nr:MAG TPA_asm: helix-turn-helix domain protein [Caudoviricetes sp.]